MIGHGHGNGAFQPPKKSVTIRAETTKTFTYSAKKKNPNRIPEYSVAKPATISESASVRSNGVRFASAVAAMKKISAPSGCWKTYQSVNQPAWFSGELVEAHRPGQQQQADDRQRQRDLVADDLGRRPQPAEQRVLVEARPAGHQQPDDRQPADREEVQQGDVHVLAEQARRERDDEQAHDRGHEHDDRGEREDEAVGAGRAEVLLRQHLEPVDDRERATRTDRPGRARSGGSSGR